MSRKKEKQNEDNGFAEWGGYMAAKKAKLLEQYNKDTCSGTKQISDIFKGIAILVNGYTTPSADEIKDLMAAHGGVYHIYQSTSGIGATTHIITSNLPNVKIKQLGNTPIVKPNWITESIATGKLLDYKKFLLYTNMDRKQPLLNFPVVNKSPEEEKFKAKTNSEVASDITNKPSSSSVMLEPKPHTSRTLTAADEGFLTEFYNNSRLHLISTLAAEFKQLINQMREKHNGKFPGKSRLTALQKAAVTGNEPVVMHIDMDCFFVSVGLRNHPELKGQPVAVTHAKGNQALRRSEASADQEFALLKKHFPLDQFEKLDPTASMSEIASCSYEARKCGINNGMFLGSALKLCPNLRTIPYDFQGYRQVSTILYKTIADYTLNIEAVSCDEMYVDVGPLLHEASITVEQWADHIRKEIMQATGCPCSTGFGANRLQARLATKKAKPAGQFHLKPEDVEEYMVGIALTDLPGVGHATVNKLNGLELRTCGDVQMCSLSVLQAELGQKMGELIHEQARGIDRKPLNYQHERKSVSADVNYGIRFKDNTEALNFLQSLSSEVFSRLQDIGMRARCLTLKLLVRAPDAPQETAKFLGCGVCNAINRSTTSGNFICEAATIYKEAKTLFERVKAPPHELRGVGIQLTRLEKIPPVNSTLTRFFHKKDVINNNCDEDNKQETVVKRNEEQDPKSIEQITVENKVINKSPLKQNLTKPLTDDKLGPSNKKIETKPGKRGRPKGSVNKTKRLINKGIQKQSKISSTSQTVNIDFNVLNELPSELREEIIKEYKLEHQATLLPCTDTEFNKKEEKAECSTSSTPDFASLNWEELKLMILNWLKSESKPKELDVTMIAEYFKQLALDRKIENLKQIISFLYRHITKLGLCSWHEAYWTIINTAQEGMVMQYGSTLLVERQFNCSVHC